jgi:ankyrin repeat protein
VVLPSGLRLIHVAAFHRQAHVVSQLVEMGADVNIVDDEGGYNPLTMAIIGGNISSALSIINAKADVRTPSRTGRFPMYVAVEKGLTEVVRALITECGIGVNERTTLETSAATPLHVAVLHGQYHIIPVLLSLGADVDILDQEKSCSPLIMAIILEDEWSVRLLIDAKANISRSSREGRSPMYIAAEKDNASILRLLVERCGIDVNAPATNEGHKGCPLHVATMFDNAHAVSVLLQMGANVYLKDALGGTAEDIAIETSSNSNPNHNSNPNPNPNPLGRTAEDIAIETSSSMALDVLRNHVRLLNLNPDPKSTF